jgi:hypothetical protein
MQCWEGDDEFLLVLTYDEICRVAAVVAAVGGCPACPSRRNSCLGMEAIARKELLLGARCICVSVLVLPNFRAMNSLAPG